eukprot:TRINITY_DN14732_c0_g1_i1.p1 TRINITY_DN14732_c0_g1~~TRINITY_DN14732_c0_g1_i1.p1  ORF type:complete len:230 (+),score=47.80 TRINITY_DN14732_c0_g1_i1:54-743(+)
MESGILHLTVVKARDLPRTEYIFTEDPYVIVNYKEIRKSRVYPKGGTNPVFNYKVPIYIESRSSGENIEISIMDSDIFFDDLMGKFVCPITMLCDYDELWVYMINSKGQQAGALLLQMQFYSSIVVPKSPTALSGPSRGKQLGVDPLAPSASSLQIMSVEEANIANMQTINIGETQQVQGFNIMASEYDIALDQTSTAAQPADPQQQFSLQTTTAGMDLTMTSTNILDE